MQKKSSTLNEFIKPSSIYRGKPFWSWNGKLDKNELLRQLDVMKEMGLGGAFMHSRTGLATEYLSDEWFSLINACAEHCKKNEMEAWLYDEDRWPSGAAGGIVTKNKKFRMKSLHININSAGNYKYSKGHIAIFAIELDGDELKSYKRITKEEVKKNTEKQIMYCEIRTQEPSSWYNGQTYLDTMSEEAVSEFIKVTHKAYKEKSGKYFGSIIPGIFTDEPNYGGFSVNGNTVNIPWTDKISQIFKKRYGYDLLNFIPEVILRYKNDDFSKARHDYIETINNLFVNAFGKMIYDFCEKNKLLYTGHVLSEESLRSQTNVVGSTMRFYEYMQAPGIDILCAQGLKREGGAEPEYLTAKQCVSVLNQMGRKWMLSELYGCTGWHFTLAEHKAVGDWQAAMGVNLRCQHLSWYTMKGEAKRDYPASIFFQSPYWRDYSVVEDYFARLSYLMSKGKPIIDIGVIHPIESAWGVAYVNLNLKNRWGFPQKNEEGKTSPMTVLDEKLCALQKILLENHFDFEYIDEDIFSRHGSVNNNMLKVGKSSYSVVIVPPLKTIRSSTLHALAKFAKNGGKLIFIESLPERVDCESSEEINKLQNNFSPIEFSEEAILKQLFPGNIKRPCIQKENGEEFKDSLYMMREGKNGDILLFICSTFQEGEEVPVKIKLPYKGYVEEWDLKDAEIYLANYHSSSEETEIKTSIGPYGSRFFVITRENRNLSPRSQLKEIRKYEIEKEEFKILRDEENAFPLDYAEFSIDGKEFQPAEEILKIDTIVREKAGWERQGGSMVQPWAYKKEKKSKSIPVILRYTFTAEELPLAPLFLAIENPERFNITLNGFELRHNGCEGWWIDNSFKKIIIPANYLVKGSNELILSINYTREDALEAIYIAGEFSVTWRKIDNKKSPEAIIGKIPEKLHLGDWCEQGFPCYSGAISYQTEFEIDEFLKNEKIYLKIPDWKGSLLKIYVNGKITGKIAWPPFELEITNFLNKGSNTINIEIVSTRRNLLGPLHNTIKYPRWTGPWDFRKGETWTDEYVRLPYGLFSKPQIVFKSVV
ncbi:MAG TPA: glycosyl hydrolase [Victivallales bacterium]|nr:glycosyl hydrolase [Victivallales bacterium]HPO91299.1 glycosyl hydrolase [Victivallales bacterium]